MSNVVSLRSVKAKKAKKMVEVRTYAEILMDLRAMSRGIKNASVRQAVRDGLDQASYISYLGDGFPVGW